MKLSEFIARCQEFDPDQEIVIASYYLTGGKIEVRHEEPDIQLRDDERLEIY